MDISTWFVRSDLDLGKVEAVSVIRLCHACLSMSRDEDQSCWKNFSDVERGITKPNMQELYHKDTEPFFKNVGPPKENIFFDHLL